MTTLHDPLTFRSGLTVKNRVVLAPMTNKQSHDDGTLSDDELHFLMSRADGGFGTITTCAAHVSKEGQGWPGELGIFDDSHVPGLERIARSMRARGAATVVQIFHGGLRANDVVSGRPRVAPSALEGALEATSDDLTRLVGAFAHAAARAERAGCDGVEIHGAHGYLLTQFLSQTHNTRTDGWGGNLEARARLLREVTRAVRARVPKTFTVGLRLSPEDFGNAKGIDLDESVRVAAWAAEDGVDYVHVSMWHSADNSAKRPEVHALPLFREAVPADVRILVAGSVWTRAEGETLLAKGADAVALGRSAIGNPDWPLRTKDPAWEPRRPPFTVEDLRARALAPGFAEYMRSWKGFVAD